MESATRKGLSRRKFIAVAAAAAGAILSGDAAENAVVTAGVVDAGTRVERPPNGTGSPGAVIMDDAWRLWLDEKAQWEKDAVYLPDEVDLTKLDINPPTNGWGSLTQQAGIPVTLPGTVEEHYWGKKPLPTANAADPRQVASLDSPYIGVSWWYRDFTPPALKPGERLVLSFPGARLRAEVYVNGQLAGYNFISEIPFMADVTSALRPRQTNQLAVRITNPGGTFSWGDFPLQHWGRYTFPTSHGFGGIDGGVTMAVHGPVSVQDLYIANHSNPRTITINTEIVSTGPAYKGPVSLLISRGGKTVWRGSVEISVPSKGRVTASRQVTVADAELWAIRHPVLYRALASIDSIAHSARITDFGFRWFNAEGIGSDAKLVLNGQRVFVSSAISWGFWAPNGMFPDKAAVERDVQAVNALGLNCTQTHRHFPKAASLDGFDHAGLLRYCEPGGGSAIWDETIKHKGLWPTGPIDTSGVGGEPVSFANRYELVKVLAMIKAYRSHPSVIMWSLNNETGANLHDAKIFYAMRKAHELDPSRILVLKSGFGPQGEVLALPYSGKLTYGDSATHHDSGWHDDHNEGDKGVYQDLDYQGPNRYKCRSVNNKDIAMWGEAGSGNSPDNYAADAQWYRSHKATGYTRAAAEVRLAAYEAFLDKYGFRPDYPTAATLLRQVGARHYFEASHLLENTRISNANDYIALSGWESTTHDNNSGLVDSLRLLKADPALMRQANAAELIVLLTRHYVVERGDTAVVDAYIVNEINRHGSFMLHFQAAIEGEIGRPFFEAVYPVAIAGGDTFGEPLREGIRFTVPRAGPVKMTAFLTAHGNTKPILRRTEPLLVVDANPAALTSAIACADFDGTLIPSLQRQFGVVGQPVASAPANAGTVLVSSSGTPRYSWTARNPLNLSHVENTDDPGLYSRQYVGQVGPVARFNGLAHGDISVELFFAEPQFNKAGQRVFDVALNGQTVLKNFDIAGEAGGKGRALVKKFSVACPDGTLSLSVPETASISAYAWIRPESAVRVSAGVKTEKCSEGGMDFCWNTNGSWEELPAQDFTGKKEIAVRAASNSNGGRVEVHLDSLSGPVAATVDVRGTGGWQKWENFFAPLNGIVGEHKVFLKCIGGGGSIFNISGVVLLPQPSLPALNSSGVPRGVQMHAGLTVPIFAAIQITDSRGKVIRQVFRRDNYRDAEGHTWNSIALAGFDWAGFLPAILDRVRSGSRLVLLGMDARDIGEAAEVLAKSHVLSYTGHSGLEDTPWIGHWYFSRKHWLLNGLPSGCVLDWQYQAAAGGDEFMVDAPGMEAVIGYGSNPGPGLGFGAVVVPLGRGRIVLLAIPGLNQAFQKGDPGGFDPVAAKRLVYNAIAG